ncbi:MAG: hypothetical protein M0R75_15585 [Dehalococcoidia bacterium]|nr:hypothetical protein [Dehalococcoidia bacterium]
MTYPRETDADGVWEIRGALRLLVEPSVAFEETRGEAFEPPAVPDYAAAMLAAFVALETLAEDTADELLAATPSFGIAMTQGNGPLSWQRLTNALAKERVTQQQYDAIAGALTANHIPAE